MSKGLLEFIAKLEHRFGTRKFRICATMALLNFMALALALEDKPEQIEVSNNDNKEEN